jgi:hypothetical protein
MWLRAGLTIEESAQSAGAGTRTVKRWLALGKRAAKVQRAQLRAAAAYDDALAAWQAKHRETIRRGRKPKQAAPTPPADWREPARDALYRHFWHEASKAIAESKALLVGRVAGDKSWKAAAWLLERRYPNEYGRRLALPAIPPGMGEGYAELVVRPETPAERDARLAAQADEPLDDDLGDADDEPLDDEADA